MNAVSEGKYDYFTDNINPNVFSNITFKELYDSSSDENKFVIWEYLQTLYALSVSLVKTREDLKNRISPGRLPMAPMTRRRAPVMIGKNSQRTWT